MTQQLSGAESTKQASKWRRGSPSRAPQAAASSEVGTTPPKGCRQCSYQKGFVFLFFFCFKYQNYKNQFI